jgi:hypothetical protein
MMDYNQIDSGVRSVVADLNKNKLHTIMSCHGHKDALNTCGYKNGKPILEKGRGWISFDKKTFNKPKVESILLKHGLRRLKFFKFAYKKDVIFVSFTRVR